MLSVCKIPSQSKMAGCRQCHRAGHIGPESNWLFLQNGEAMATSRNRRTGLGVATGTYIYFHCVTATNAGSRTPTERSSLASSQTTLEPSPDASNQRLVASIAEATIRGRAPDSQVAVPVKSVRQYHIPHDLVSPACHTRSSADISRVDHDVCIWVNFSVVLAQHCEIGELAGRDRTLLLLLE